MSHQRTAFILVLGGCALLTSVSAYRCWITYQGGRAFARQLLTERGTPAAPAASGENDASQPGAHAPSASSSAVAQPISAPATGKRPTPRAPDVAWNHPGLCASGSAKESLQQRAQFLSGFVPFSASDSTLYAEPSVPHEAVAVIQKHVPEIRKRVALALGLDAVAATIFLYPSLETLQKHACVVSSAVAYYDGAIHLAMVPSAWNYSEPIRSLTHEYVHHALVSNGVTEPVWLQEGAAMTIAGEQQWGMWPRVWKDHPLTIDQMVRAFPNSASAEFAQAFYGQAFAMVEFLDRLCLNEPSCGLEALVSALKSGQTTPSALFDSAVSAHGGDLVRTSTLPLWDDYVIHQDFAPATKNALLRRALPR